MSMGLGGTNLPLNYNSLEYYEYMQSVNEKFDRYGYEGVRTEHADLNNDGHNELLNFYAEPYEAPLYQAIDLDSNGIVEKEILNSEIYLHGYTDEGMSYAEYDNETGKMLSRTIVNKDGTTAKEYLFEYDSNGLTKKTFKYVDDEGKHRKSVTGYYPDGRESYQELYTPDSEPIYWEYSYDDIENTVTRVSKDINDKTKVSHSVTYPVDDISKTISETYYEDDGKTVSRSSTFDWISDYEYIEYEDDHGDGSIDYEKRINFSNGTYETKDLRSIWNKFLDLFR